MANECVIFEADEDKFKELVLYIASKSADDPEFGATKLNKLLFAVDLFAYGYLGEPITGVEYVKREYGPAPRRFLPISNAMKEEGILATEERPYRGTTLKRPIALRAPNLELFTAKEIALVNSVYNDFKGIGTVKISEWSHGLCGWAIADDNDTIPYEVVFLSDRPMTAYEAERGRQLALERGWNVF